MLKSKKVDESEVLKFGFLAGVAEAAYIMFVVLVIKLVGNTIPKADNDIAGALMFLLILVFSAAISGLLLFGYPIYLAIQKRFAESIMTIATTLVTLAIVGILVFLLVSII